MAPEENNTIAVDGQIVDLRNRYLAALLAWLIPGAGHLYQGRRTKGQLFFVCILLDKSAILHICRRFGGGGGAVVKLVI